MLVPRRADMIPLHPQLRVRGPNPARQAAIGARIDSRSFARTPAFDVTTSAPTSSPSEDITGLAPTGVVPRHRTGGGDRGGNEAESEPQSPEPSPEGGDFSMAAIGEDQVTPDRRSS